MGSTWAVLNAIWRRKDAKPLFQMFQIYLYILNNNILLVPAVTVIEPIAVDLNLQLRSIKIIHKSIILLKIKRIYC